MPTVSSGSSSALQITGLASGLDTNAIISALIAVDQQPITRLQSSQSSLQSLNNSLTSIQTSLQTLALNAQALQDPGLFAPSQAVTSSNATLVGATAASGVGAVVGATTVTVGNLASSAQRTFTFTSPASAGTITIDGEPINIAAGATAQTLATAINSDKNADVWATPTQNGASIVLSSRTTGQKSGSFIQVSDPTGTLAEQTSLAQNGQNANYTINGVPGSSPSDTLTNAIPGVTLTLAGVTPAGSPVTINVQPPAPSTSSIESAVNAFVSSYNSVLGSLQSQVNTQPAKGQTAPLFGDNELRSLMSNMRSAMYAPGTGLPTGMASLADIGITTGAPTGTAGFSQSAVQGQLSVNKTTLEAALQSNPSGVQAVLESWAGSFTAIVNNEAEPGGALDARIQGNGREISQLSNRISSMQQMLSDRQTALQAQFAKLEGTLSGYQSQGAWLASQIAGLPVTH